MAERCQVCGSKLPEGEVVCRKCGYAPPGGRFGDVRDNIHAAKKIKKLPEQFNILVSQLEHLDITSTGISEISAMVSEILSFLTIPLYLETASDLKLDSRERDVIDLLYDKLKESDVHFNTPVAEQETYIKLGNAEFGCGDAGRALEFYDKSILKNPNNVNALYNKARVLFSIHNYEGSLRCLEKILKIAPEHEMSAHFKPLVEQMLR